MYNIIGDDNSDCQVIGTKSHCKEVNPLCKISGYWQCWCGTLQNAVVTFL